MTKYIIPSVPNRNIFRLITLSLFLCSGMLRFSAYGELEFTNSARMSSGKWVKIAIPASGIYEVSYEKLIELGFSNPSRVGVCGAGGRELPLNLTDAQGEALVNTDVEPIKVIHRPDRLIFYAQGPDNIVWQKSADLPETGGRFSNAGLNFYSSYGWYFLTDTVLQEIEPEGTSSSIRIPAVRTGESFVYHEKDISQGPTNCGKELWGETFAAKTARTQTFPVSLPGNTGAHTGAMECSFMSSCYAAGNLEYGLIEESNVTGQVPGAPSGTNFMLNTKKYGSCGIPADNPIVTIAYKAYSTVATAHLDYFVVTYKRNLKLSSDESWFPAHVKTTSRSVIPAENGSENLRVLDITDPTSPSFLPRTSDGFETSGERILAFFNIDTPFSNPSHYIPIENQNLHALPDKENPVMIVIHTDEVKEVAEEFVTFHKTLGENVIAIPIEKIYNEYSSGRPDPMAIRLFTKTFVQKENSKLTSLLLLGPVVGYPKFSQDLTGRLILPQSESGAYSTDTYGFLDLYGMTDSYFSGKLAVRPINLDVAVLPVNSVAEGNNYLSKLKSFYYDTSKHQWADNTLFMCDDNNKGMHLKSVESLLNELNTYSDGRLTTVKNYLGETGPRNVLPYWISQAERGMMYSLYMGHGALFSIGSWEFYKPGYFNKFHNNRLGFMIFSGCMTTGYETLRAGVGESLILKSSKGLFGGIVTARSVWAQDNHNLINRFHSELFVPEDASKGIPRTIGRALLYAKQKEENTNKFNFHLMCDPLIRIPLPLLDIKNDLPSTVTPGKSITLKGNITSGEGEKQNDFNGKIAVKWHSPQLSRTARCMYSHDVLDDVITYDQDVVEIQEGDVKNGSFSLTLSCPAFLNMYGGNDLTVSLCAYDPDKRTTGSKKMKVHVSETSSSSADTTPPVIESFCFEGTASSSAQAGAILIAEVSDDTGIRASSGNAQSNISILIDGMAVQYPASFISLSDGGRCMKIRMPLPALTDGYHSAGLDVTDYAGNRSHASFDFTIIPDLLDESPETCDGVFTDDIEMELPGDLSMLTKAVLRIFNSEGELIRILPASPHTVWNLTDRNGERVRAGVYKAIVSGIADNGTSVCSRPLYLPVLRENKGIFAQ